MDKLVTQHTKHSYPVSPLDNASANAALLQLHAATRVHPVSAVLMSAEPAAWPDLGFAKCPDLSFKAVGTIFKCHAVLVAMQNANAPLTCQPLSACTYLAPGMRHLHLHTQFLLVIGKLRLAGHALFF